ISGAVDPERAVDPFRGAHGQRVGRRAGLVTGDIAIGRHVGRARHDVVVGGGGGGGVVGDDRHFRIAVGVAAAGGGQQRDGERGGKQDGGLAHGGSPGAPCPDGRFPYRTPAVNARSATPRIQRSWLSLLPRRL